MFMDHVDHQMGDTEGARILLADDDPIVRAHLRELLEDQGYLIVGEAGDGLSAVDLARQFRPDLVLSDVKMPQMDGLKMAHVLREEKLAPVILITSYSDRELAHQACRAGVHGYLVKPVQEGDLRPMIEVARARWVDYCARHFELLHLREKLETRTVIESAKVLLMESQGLRESDAFRKIQRLAMNNRTTMKEVAQAIMLAQQIHA